MHTFFSFKVFLLVAVLLALPGRADARWTRIQTDNFVFVGDASERSIRSIAQRLETFRETLTRLFSARATTSSVPTVVVVFQNDKSLAAYKPRYNGRAVGVGGYFIPSDETNYIVVNAELEQQAYGVIFHEYSHFLLGNAVGDVPLWLNEGLAEFYQTFELRDKGQGAMVGIASDENLQLLASTMTLLPIPELIGVTHSSPMYNEGSRRGVFYAQSWALVHYLTLGSKEREGQLQNYLNLVNQGVSPTDAFPRALGADIPGLEKELRQYLQRHTFNALRLRFDEKLSAVETSNGEVIADAEATGYLGDLMSAIGQTDAARAMLRQTLDGTPDAVRAMLALSLLELRESNRDVALTLAEQAASAGPNLPGAHRMLGRLLADRAMRGGLDEDALFERAHVALKRATELEPHNISTAVMLGRVEMMLDGREASAVATLRGVVAAAPGREDYRLMLAEALVRQEDYDSASTILGPMMGRSRQPENAMAARRLLSYIADVKNRALRAADPALNASAPPVTRTVGPAVPPSRGGKPPMTILGTSITIPVDDAYASTSRVLPALRQIQGGEEQVMGVFSAVDCRQGSIVLLIETVTGQMQMSVPAFDAVEFLTYRADSPAGIPCGVQNPSYRVLATFRPGQPPLRGAADVANRAVAIELLPDGYVPREPRRP